MFDAWDASHHRLFNALRVDLECSQSHDILHIPAHLLPPANLLAGSNALQPLNLVFQFFNFFIVLFYSCDWKRTDNWIIASENWILWINDWIEFEYNIKRCTFLRCSIQYMSRVIFGCWILLQKNTGEILLISFLSLFSTRKRLLNFPCKLNG